MIVNFDVGIYWQHVPISYVHENMIYMAAPPPHRIILVVQASLAQQIDQIAGNLHYTDASKVYDCSIGWHDGARYPDFVLPRYAGLSHTKLTVRKRLPADTEGAKNLSEILANAPEGSAGRRETAWHGVYAPVKVPEALWIVANQLAKKHFGDRPDAIIDMINEALLHYVEDLT